MNRMRPFFSGLIAAAVVGAAYAVVKRLRSSSLQSASQAGKAKSPAHTFATSDARRIDLNRASIEDLAAIAGIDSVVADRIIENRPYRNKLDLLARMVIPQHIYRQISNSIEVSEPMVPVKVA